MSRRLSSRKRGPKLRKLTRSEELGLGSFVKENMRECVSALGLASTSTFSSQEEVVLKLREVMGLNALSVEELLTRFMSKDSLRRYCEKILNKSGKGTSPVLASRISREWAKASFDPNKIVVKEKSSIVKRKNKKEQKKLCEEREKALETPFEDDGTKLTIRFRGRDVSSRTIQVPSQAPLKYLKAMIAKEIEQTKLGQIDLLSGFPPRSLSLKTTSKNAPISSFLRTNELITITSLSSSSASNRSTKKRTTPEKRKRATTNTTTSSASKIVQSSKPKRRRVTNANSEDGVTLLKKLSQNKMKSHLETIRANKRLRAAFGKQWKITENQDVRRVDGQVSEMIVHFKFGQRKWEKEKVTRMKEDELRAVIRHVLSNLGDAKEQLRLSNLAQVSPRVFWNLCVWDLNNPAPSLSAVASLEYSLSRLLPDEDWSFLKSRKRKLSTKAKQNQQSVSEKEMRKAAKLIADVAASNKKKKEEYEIVWSKQGPHIGVRVRRFFSHGPSDGTVVMYSKPRMKDDVALWRICHDDGDEEDLEEHELRLAIDVMTKWKSSGHPAKLKRGLVKITLLGKNHSNVYTETHRYIGRKVFRVFGDVVVTGIVTEFYDANKSSEMLWHVVHNDGDEEDLSKEQVEEAIERFRLEDERKEEQEESLISNNTTLSSVIAEHEIVTFLQDKINIRNLEDLAQANAFELRQHVRQGLRIRVTEDGVQEYIDRAQILSSNSIMRNLLDDLINLQSFRRISGIRFPVELSRCVPEDLHRKFDHDNRVTLDSVRKWISEARNIVEKKSWLMRPPPLSII